MASHQDCYHLMGPCKEGIIFACGLYIQPLFTQTFSHLVPYPKLPILPTAGAGPHKLPKGPGGTFLVESDLYPGR